MSIEVASWSLTTAIHNLQQGKLSAEEYLTDLISHGNSHSNLGTYITPTSGHALIAARAADSMPQKGPLFGIPLVVKDNIDVAGVPTTAATPSLKGHIPTTDSEVWQRLTSAGAILLGKTSMHELAYGITGICTGSPTALNPVNTNYLAGGSSSGTAAAIAAGFAPAGLGTDTGGSIRIPAAVCGIFGFRPTTGRYPHAGVVRISPTRDTVGLMARSIEDILLLDEIITGTNHSTEQPSPTPKSVRLAIPESAWDHLDPEVERITTNALSVLENAGYKLINTGVDIHGGPSNELLDTAIAIPPPETLAAISAYLAETGSTITAEEVIKETASPDVRSILSPLLDTSLPHHAYHAALTKQEQLQALANEARHRYNIDAIVTPTIITPAAPVDVADYINIEGVEIPTFLAYIRNTAPAAVLATPSITIPIGKTAEGLPVGLQLDGHPNSDTKLLQLALQCSQLFPSVYPSKG